MEKQQIIIELENTERRKEEQRRFYEMYQKRLNEMREQKDVERREGK